MRNISLRAVILLVSLLLAGHSAWAQSTAQVSGQVKDQSGAVLPGVEVTVTQTETGLKRTAVTDETGSYVFPNLPIGPYRVEAALPGFKTYAQTGIVLQVGSSPQINAVLEVGQVSDQIEVQADAALVETRTTGVGQVMDNTRVLELPLNGRQVSDLILLSGAAVQGGASFTMGTRGYSQVQISVAGGQAAGVEYNLDGGTHNDVYTGLGVTMPFPDALQEFKLETSALPAQYGHHSSSAVNAVTKSGTNDFHGSVFEFLRNNFLNANNAATQTRDTLKRNQFGGTFGGPIVRNKLFFFGGIQATKEKSAASPAPQFVPTEAMLQGDFTAFASRACAGAQRTLRTPFASGGTDANGNTIYRISPALFSPAALNLVKRLPAAQDDCGTMRFSRLSRNNEYTTVGRVDYTVSQQHSLLARFLGSRTNNPTDYDGVNILTEGRANLVANIYSFVLGDTYSFGSNMVSSARATLNRISNVNEMPHTFAVEDLLAPGKVFSDKPFYSWITVTSGFNIGGGCCINTAYNTLAYQFVDDLSLVRGSHQYGFGGTFIRTHENTQAGSNRNPRPAFNGGTTGTGLTDLLLGKMSSMQQANPGYAYKRQNYVSFYVQDTWKATSRFTVNAGIRWEPYQPPNHIRNQTIFFDQDAFNKNIHSVTYKNAPAGLQFPGDPDVPGNKYGFSNWNQWAPRLGIAWDPKGDGRMTIRSAYGLFYEIPYGQKSAPLIVAAPYAGGVQTLTPRGGFDDPWSDIGGNPFPVSLANPTFLPRGTYPVYPKRMHNPLIGQWNLSVQRQVSQNWLVTANYLGTSTTHLWTSQELNPAVYIPGNCVAGQYGLTAAGPCSSRNNIDARRALYLQDPANGIYYALIASMDDGGTANYNGLLLSVQHRKTNGLTMTGNYTLSHCIGDMEETQLQNLAVPANARRYYYRGNCSQDRRQNGNVSTVYEIPKFSNSTLQMLAGGWKMSGILRFQTGSYLTIASGIDTSLTGSTGGDRANQVLPNGYADEKTVDHWFNRAAFAQPVDGQFGNLAANNLRGPGSIRFDMGLTRTFQIRENQTVEFRGEAFNVANHVNLGSPNTSLNSSSFGKITTVDDPRIMQFSLKYVF